MKLSYIMLVISGCLTQYIKSIVIRYIPFISLTWVGRLSTLILTQSPTSSTGVLPKVATYSAEPWGLNAFKACSWIDKHSVERLPKKILNSENKMV